MQEETLSTSTSSGSGYLPVSTYPNLDPQSDDKNSESAAVVSNALLAGGERVVTDCSSCGVWQRWSTVSGSHFNGQC